MSNPGNPSDSAALRFSDDVFDLLTSAAEKPARQFPLSPPDWVPDFNDETPITPLVLLVSSCFFLDRNDSLSGGLCAGRDCFGINDRLCTSSPAYFGEALPLIPLQLPCVDLLSIVHADFATVICEDCFHMTRQNLCQRRIVGR